MTLTTLPDPIIEQDRMVQAISISPRPYQLAAVDAVRAVCRRGMRRWVSLAF